MRTIPALALATLTVALTFTATTPARADGDSASFSLYRVTPGHTADFQTAYAQHIRWHLEARDPWAWYVWQVGTGPERGQFMGGTFDRAWDDHDRRPRPDEDAADHRRTIDRHVDGGHPRYLTHRRDLGGTLPLLETAPELIVIQIRPAPGRRADVEAAAKRLASLAGPGARFGWYEVITGGAPDLLLFVPLARSSELANASLTTLWRAPAARAADVRAAALRLEAASASVESTLLRFKPELSSCVRAESKCVGAVPSS